VGEAGEFGEVLGLVPDEAEDVADLVDEAGAGSAAAAVLEGGEIGGGDLQALGAVLLAHATLGTQRAEAGAEGGHPRGSDRQGEGVLF